jgi:acyl-CoA synthetase (AMP-forming)/AMP-acid ligase II
MAELTRDRAEARGDDIAMSDEFTSRTYSEVNERVNRLIHALREAGIGTGTSAGLLSGNRHEFFEISNACCTPGSPSSPELALHPGEIAYVLDGLRCHGRPSPTTSTATWPGDSAERVRRSRPGWPSVARS